MKTLLCTIFALFLMSVSIAAEDLGTVIYTESNGMYSVDKKGIWSESKLTGFNGTKVLTVPANNDTSITWKINSSMGLGTFRAYLWHSISETGCENATISYNSEFQPEKVRKVDMRHGKSGWQEIGIYSISGAGTSLTLKGSRGDLLVNSLRFVPLDKKYQCLRKVFEAFPGGILLKIGSGIAYVDGVTKQLSDASPVIENNMTLVPIRFITETMGAKVLWDNTVKSATIQLGEREFVFTEGSMTYTADGIEKMLDQAAITINDRLMIPLRVLSEDIGKKVYWQNQGIIMISDSENTTVFKDKNNLEDILGIFNN